MVATLWTRDANKNIAFLFLSFSKGVRMHANFWNALYEDLVVQLTRSSFKEEDIREGVVALLPSFSCRVVTCHRLHAPRAVDVSMIYLTETTFPKGARTP